MGPKAGYGGVLMLARANVDMIVHTLDSEHAERQWFTLLTGTGPLLLGNWYRPPDAPIEAIRSFHSEMSVLMESHSSAHLVGDLNVHHKK